MILGILTILIGLAFLFPSVIETIAYWRDPAGMTVGMVGTVISLLLMLTGWAILRQWTSAKRLVIVIAASWLIFSSIAGSLHFLGIPALLAGLVFPIVLVTAYLRADANKVG